MERSDLKKKKNGVTDIRFWFLLFFLLAAEHLWTCEYCVSVISSKSKNQNKKNSSWSPELKQQIQNDTVKHGHTQSHSDWKLQGHESFPMGETFTITTMFPA